MGIMEAKMAKQKHSRELVVLTFVHLDGGSRNNLRDEGLNLIPFFWLSALAL